MDKSSFFLDMNKKEFEMFMWFKNLLRLSANNKGYKFSYLFYLSNFKFFKISKLEGDDKEYIDSIINKIRSFDETFPRKGECYYNSFLVSLYSKDKVKYCEGFLHGIIVLEHSWINYNGKNYDITFEYNKYIDNNTEYAYFGMQFDFQEREKLNNVSESGFVEPIIPTLVWEKFKEAENGKDNKIVL